MQTVAIIQARMNSSRLPGKVLKEILGKPMLMWVVERTARSQLVQTVAVATTTHASDDPIEALCRERGIPCWRGSQFDVLDRYYQAARLMQADVIVRLTGDCPLIDPQVIDRTVQAFFQQGVDFAANRLPPPWKRTYPIGLDVEVCSFAALERAWHEARQPYEREHVMPYLYDEPGRFRTFLVNTEPDYGHLRWTVDTPEDLEFVRQVVEKLDGQDHFSWLDVLALLQQYPHLADINADVRHKVFNEVDERLKGTDSSTQDA